MNLTLIIYNDWCAIKRNQTKQMQTTTSTTNNNNNISHDKTWTWLRKGNFKRETESILVAA